MKTIELLLVAGVLVGTLVALFGELLKHRRTPNEHWLWKKRRLMRAKFMMAGGTTVSALSAVVFVFI